MKNESLSFCHPDQWGKKTKVQKWKSMQVKAYSLT
jgi:hypothetical protein